MVATLQFWMCEASYASGLYVNASIQFSVGKYQSDTRHMSDIKQ